MGFAFYRTETFKNNLDTSRLGFTALQNIPGYKKAKESDFPVARRPFEGLTIQENTPAYITVITKDGRNLMLVNSTNPDSGTPADAQNPPDKTSSFYNDFMLLSITESREEKINVHETFGQTFVFFSGEKPRFLSCSGLLIDSLNFTWKSQWWMNYDKYLRGTKAVENQARVYLYFKNVLVGGYIIRADTLTRSDDPHQCPLSFTFLITDYVDVVADNFSAFRSTSLATGTSNGLSEGELTTSIANEVTSHGEMVDFGDSFLRRQLKLAFGSASPATYLNAIAQDPSLIYKNPGVFTPAHAIDRVKTLSPLADAVDAAPIASTVGAPVGAPLQRMLVQGTRATGSAVGTVIDAKADPSSLSYIATGKTAREVLGKTLTGTSAMVRW